MPALQRPAGDTTCGRLLALHAGRHARLMIVRACAPVPSARLLTQAAGALVTTQRQPPAADRRTKTRSRCTANVRAQALGRGQVLWDTCGKDGSSRRPESLEFTAASSTRSVRAARGRLAGCTRQPPVKPDAMRPAPTLGILRRAVASLRSAGGLCATGSTCYEARRRAGSRMLASQIDSCVQRANSHSFTRSRSCPVRSAIRCDNAHGSVAKRSSQLSMCWTGS